MLIYNFQFISTQFNIKYLDSDFAKMTQKKRAEWLRFTRWLFVERDTRCSAFAERSRCRVR